MGSIKSNLLTKAKFIFKHCGGIYTLLPRGLAAIRKIVSLCRRIMATTHFNEVEMPLLIPQSLLSADRLAAFGHTLFNTQSYFLAPTHEEVVAQLFKSHIQSYKQLPAHFLQFSKKFRNELRVKSGLIRCREFIMQDSYSAHLSEECLDNLYQQIRLAYGQIFTSLQLNFIIAQASGETMLSNASEEFHVPCSEGEDVLCVDANSHAVNIECASTFLPRLPQVVAVKLYEVNNTVYILPAGEALNHHKIKGKAIEISMICNQQVVADCCLKNRQLKLAGNTLVVPQLKLQNIKLPAAHHCCAAGKPIKLVQTTEIGHIFKLGTHYSDTLKVDSPTGKKKVIMGCYGIGISRLLAVCSTEVKKQLHLPALINPVDLLVRYRNSCSTLPLKQALSSYNINCEYLLFKDQPDLYVPVHIEITHRNEYVVRKNDTNQADKFSCPKLAVQTALKDIV